MEASSQAQLAAVPKAAAKRNGKPHDPVKAAKGEVLDEAKVVDWHGLALTLPPKLPASMMFEMTEAEVLGDEATTGSSAVHAVYRMLGKEQWKKAKDWSDDLGLSADEFGDFINEVFSAYGMGSSGEASASSIGSESDGG